ncbi:hypothetical protein BGZ90_007233 [Linnemannia elongata]|nr:hypothetical protein BGZ90_007233 [Linnemannia elongata]
MHPAQLALPFTSHSHDTLTSPSTNSSPTTTEALNNLFLVDHSEDYQRTAELLDIGLPNYIDGLSPPPSALMFDTTMCDTTGIATIAQQLQQHQIGDLEPELHGSGGAGSQLPTTSGPSTAGTPPPGPPATGFTGTMASFSAATTTIQPDNCLNSRPRSTTASGVAIPVVQSLKRRRRLTTEESEFLMVQFNLNGRPTAQERDSFARHLKLDRRTIQVWFQNRRAKLKRDERGGCRQNRRE